MTRRTACVALLALGALSAPSAQAAYVVTFEEMGPNVVETGSGTLDLAALSPDGTTTFDPVLIPGFAAYGSGVEGAEEDQYTGNLPGGPSSWGPGGRFTPITSMGDAVAYMDDQPFGFTNIDVPHGYAFGTHLSETSTYLGSFSSLGLTAGTYVYSFGSGADADTFTVDVVASPSLTIPEPSTWAMMLAGFAGLGYAALRRRSKVRYKN
jgi:hypothetical protein